MTDPYWIGMRLEMKPPEGRMEMSRRLTPPIAESIEEAVEHGRKMSKDRKQLINKDNVVKIADYLNAVNLASNRKIRNFMRKTYRVSVSGYEISAARVLVE